MGRIFDDRGNRMTPSTANKGGIRYRYYVSSVMAQGRQNEAGSVRRVSAPEIESFIVQALRTAYPLDGDLDDLALIYARADRLVLHQDGIDLHPSSDPATPMRLAWSPAPTVRRREILRPSAIESHERGIKAESRTVLLRSIALARKWLDEVLGGSTADQIALRERCSKRHIANTIPLAFLAPDLVRAVIDARLPRGISATRVAEPELEWSRQWEMLGIRP